MKVRAVEVPTESPPLSMGLVFGGAPGYVRATLVVERPADPAVEKSARSALYDSAFPIGREAHLRVMVTPPVGPTMAPRITLRVESAGVASDSVVEPAVPFFEPGAIVRWTSALGEGADLPENTEVEVGRWTVISGPTTTMVVLRLLRSWEPVGPRLKGQGSAATG